MTDTPIPPRPLAPETGGLLDRRRFIGAGSALALGLLSAHGRLYAEEFVPAPAASQGPVEAVGCAVIGLGEHGRALLSALTNVNGADLRYLCDTYEATHKRALEIFPKATATTDFRKVLDDQAVRAVWIATPTHLHRELAIAALKAGKHVYCETPLAGTVEDARAIAAAAQAAAGQVFHCGLQLRTDPQHKHVLSFVRTGALGTMAQCQGHSHRRTSWRRTASNDERQHALNWRLSKATSTGLLGEIGIHQLDVASWFLKALPVSVTAFGAIRCWNDGREIADTVQCIVEYPGGIRFLYDATLANSFDASGELFQGSEAAVLIRDHRAWMFKESDSAALGWEVYAYREKVGDDTGIALVADATKILAAGKQPGENREVDPRRTPLVCASEDFLTAVREKKPSACPALVGFQATVAAIKAHEASLAGGTVVFQKEWFEL
jgi:predicted dehydrogenase